MSSFLSKTKHPVTGRWANALWIDDYFGRRHYGVLFPAVSYGFDVWKMMENRKLWEVFDPEAYEIETSDVYDTNEL